MKQFIATLAFISLLSPHLVFAQADQTAMPQLETSTKIIDEEDFLFDDAEVVDSEGLNPSAQAPTLFSDKPAPPPPPSDVKIKDDLTSTIAENNQGDSEQSSEKKGESWIKKLSPLSSSAEASSSLTGDTLESLVKETKSKQKLQKKGSNASVFDIAGVMLRMSLEQADKTLNSRGYKKTSEKMEIPNFIRWRNEETCRNQGVIGYERLNSCVVEMAKKDNHQYIETVGYNKFDTSEEIVLNLTSNFTNNKIYKIYYRSMTTNVTGNSNKALYIRNIKIYDFWKHISQKYGVPDNTDDVIWTMGENMPYLRADTGKLLLEDPMLRELDYTRMSREDQRYLNTNLYNF